MGGSRKKAVKFVATFFRWLKTALSTCNTMTSVISLDGLLIDKQFVVGQQIGKGSFGVVHQAKDRLSGRIVAIKFESKNTPHAQLFNEFRVIISLMFYVQSASKYFFLRSRFKFYHSFVYLQNKIGVQNAWFS